MVYQGPAMLPLLDMSHHFITLTDRFSSLLLSRTTSTVTDTSISATAPIIPVEQHSMILSGPSYRQQQQHHTAVSIPDESLIPTSVTVTVPMTTMNNTSNDRIAPRDNTFIPTDDDDTKSAGAVRTTTNSSRDNNGSSASYTCTCQVRYVTVRDLQQQTNVSPLSLRYGMVHVDSLLCHVIYLR
jgi:hypothetical protein